MYAETAPQECEDMIRGNRCRRHDGSDFSGGGSFLEPPLNLNLAGLACDNHNVRVCRCKDCSGKIDPSAPTHNYEIRAFGLSEDLLAVIGVQILGFRVKGFGRPGMRWTCLVKRMGADD